MLVLRHGKKPVRNLSSASLWKKLNCENPVSILSTGSGEKVACQVAFCRKSTYLSTEMVNHVDFSRTSIKG